MLQEHMDFTQFSLSDVQRNNNDHEHTGSVQTKFNMGSTCLDNLHQSFWQLIDHTVKYVLA